MLILNFSKTISKCFFLHNAHRLDLHKDLLQFLGVACGDPQPAIRDQFGEVINWRPGPYFVGRTFRFRCLFGHKLLGSSERTCMANGRWSGRTTACNQIGKTYFLFISLQFTKT